MSAGPFVAVLLCAVSVVTDGRLSSTALVAAIVVVAVHGVAGRPPVPPSGWSLLRAHVGTVVVTDDDSRWIVQSVSRRLPANPLDPEHMTIDLSRTTTDTTTRS